MFILVEDKHVLFLGGRWIFSSKSHIPPTWPSLKPSTVLVIKCDTKHHTDDVTGNCQKKISESNW